MKLLNSIKYRQRLLVKLIMAEDILMNFYLIRFVAIDIIHLFFMVLKDIIHYLNRKKLLIRFMMI